MIFLWEVSNQYGSSTCNAATASSMIRMGGFSSHEFLMGGFSSAIFLGGRFQTSTVPVHDSTTRPPTRPMSTGAASSSGAADAAAGDFSIERPQKAS